MQYKCNTCKHVYYGGSFCGYSERNCKIHGMIDCNPDSYLRTLKNKKCPDYKKKEKNNAK
jgi:hypothetical protein